MASSGNFMTFNRLAYQNSYSASYSQLDTGNLRGNATAGGWGWPSNYTFDSGKWYCEFYVYRRSGSSIGYISVVDHYYPHIDAKYNDNRHRQPTVADYTVRYHGGGVTATTTTGIYNNQIGAVNESQTFASDQWQDGDVLAIALDLDSSPQTVQFYRNGSAKGNAENLNSSASGSWAFWCGSHNQTWITMNAGQDSSFAGNKTAQGNTDGNGFGDFYYSPPSGFLACCSANLPTSDDINPAKTDTNYPSKLFNAVTYTGNASTNAITGVGFRPDLFWFQRRDYAGNFNQGMLDSSRGVSVGMYPDRQDADTSFTSDFSSFDSDGVTLKAGSSANINNSGSAFIGWFWKANGGTTSTNNDGSTTSTVQSSQAGGFSIITYTGNGSNRTIGHGLTKAPEFMIIKDRTNSGSNWIVYHKDQGAGNRSQLNTSTAFGSSSGSFQSTDPTSSVISLGTSGGTNANSANFVCYAWHSVDGYCKVGTTIGNGSSSDGTFTYLGFRPRFIIYKRSTDSNYFYLLDTARNTINGEALKLLAPIGVTESGHGTSNKMDFLSQGFKMYTSGGGLNGSGGNYVYIAWGDQPARFSNAR